MEAMALWAAQLKAIWKDDQAEGIRETLGLGLWFNWKLEVGIHPPSFFFCLLQALRSLLTVLRGLCGRRSVGQLSG